MTNLSSEKLIEILDQHVFVIKINDEEFKLKDWISAADVFFGKNQSEYETDKEYFLLLIADKVNNISKKEMFNKLAQLTDEQLFELGHKYIEKDEKLNKLYNELSIEPDFYKRFKKAMDNYRKEAEEVQRKQAERFLGKDLLRSLDAYSDFAKKTADLGKSMQYAIDYSKQIDWQSFKRQLPLMSQMASEEIFSMTNHIQKMNISPYSNRELLSTALMNTAINSPILEKVLYNNISREYLFNTIEKLPDRFHLSILTDDTLAIEDSASKSEVPLDTVVSNLGIIDLVANISYDEMNDFFQFLTQYPMMGLCHNVGTKIKEFVLSVKCNLVTIQDIELYRARIRPSTQSRPLSVNELYEPPYGIASQGRFNLAGESSLYTSEDKDCAIEELKCGNDETIDIVQWKLVTPISFLDISQGDYPLFKFCRFGSTPNSTRNDLSYIVPNFLAQCCKLFGIQGIIFKSAIIQDKKNYVFFDYAKKDFEMIKVIEEIRD